MLNRMTRTAVLDGTMDFNRLARFGLAELIDMRALIDGKLSELDATEDAARLVLRSVPYTRATLNGRLEKLNQAIHGQRHNVHKLKKGRAG